MSDAPLVRMRGITKCFPGVVALNKVDLALYPGEVHAVVGENGSGKSTLCKCLYGMYRPDEGSIEIDGTICEIGTPNRALQLGITAITQELTLAPTLSVTENILMGRLPRGRFGINWKKARLFARDALDQVGAEIDERRQVGSLSAELQQEVEIARAVSTQSRVLILDEATSAPSQIPFAIVETGKGRTVGSSRYLNIRNEHKSLEIGWTWIGQEWQRTAVNTQVKLLLMSHAFEQLGCVRVEFKTDARNERSQQALLRIGATREGVLRNHMIVQNNYVRDSVYFSVTEAEWPAVKARLEALANRAG